MNLPITFLSGLAVLALHDQLWMTLPGEARPLTLLPYLTLAAVPAILALINGRRLRSCGLARAVPMLPLRTALRLQSAAVPLSYAIIVVFGELPAVAEAIAPWSVSMQFALLIAPLLGAEIALRLAERGSAHWLEVTGIGGVPTLGPQRLPMALFVLTPIVVFAVAADLMAQERHLEVFFKVTTIGSTIGVGLGVLLLCLTLPLFFRWFLPTSTDLPRYVAYDVRATAAALGFRPNQILAMHTGHRMVNAAMVGPLPWPRYLVLTDGIMSLLEPSALRGVVAHEVGHARAGHPALLLLVFAGLPMLLVHPLMLLDFDAGSTNLWIGAGVTVAVIAYFGLRAMAHRFEFEADLMSAEALGGAEPCINALRRVGELYPQHQHKSTFRHPSEDQRILNLLAWEGDHRFRRSFHRAGRRLRAVIATLLAASIGLSVWAHIEMWPVDRTTYLLYSGEFPAAQRTVEAIDRPILGVTDNELNELKQTVAAALELFPEGGRWEEIREPLAERAWRRAVDELRTVGPLAARPWFRLALARPVTTPLERSVYLYCDAAAREDSGEAARIREHVFTLAPSTELTEALLR